MYIKTSPGKWSSYFIEIFIKTLVLLASASLNLFQGWQTKDYDHLHYWCSLPRRGQQTHSFKGQIFSVPSRKLGFVVIVSILQVSSGNSFMWKSQLRHSWDWESQDCWVNICDAQFRYQHEVLHHAAPCRAVLLVAAVPGQHPAAGHHPPHRPLLHHPHTGRHGSNSVQTIIRCDLH